MEISLKKQNFTQCGDLYKPPRNLAIIKELEDLCRHTSSR